MKQRLYVYIPGFEYNSKGPLHIDAIKLDAYVESETPNKLDVFCFKGKNKTFKGNLLYRYANQAVGSQYSYGVTISGSTQTNIQGDLYTSKESQASWIDKEVEQEGRVPIGFFYDHITDSKEQVHHVIGIHKTKDKCLNQANNTNQNPEEHDGLFILELESLNVNIILTFTFFSEIHGTESNGNLRVGYIDKRVATLSQFQAQHTFVGDENFYNNYIEVGKWTQTYNPSTSGIEQAVLSIPENFTPQYFNLKYWGKASERKWEIPVNYGMLVSDMSINENKINDFYKQYTYDSENLCHVLSNAECNSYENASNFYCGFYELSNQVELKDKKYIETNYSIANNSDSYTKAILCKKKGTHWISDISPFINIHVNAKPTYDFTKTYPLCGVSLENLGYLYKASPTVNIVNVQLSGNTTQKNNKMLFAVHVPEVTGTDPYSNKTSTVICNNSIYNNTNPEQKYLNGAAIKELGDGNEDKDVLICKTSIGGSAPSTLKVNEQTIKCDYQETYKTDDIEEQVLFLKKDLSSDISTITDTDLAKTIKYYLDKKVPKSLLIDPRNVRSAYSRVAFSKDLLSGSILSKSSFSQKLSMSRNNCLNINIFPKSEYLKLLKFGIKASSIKVPDGQLYNDSFTAALNKIPFPERRLEDEYNNVLASMQVGRIYPLLDQTFQIDLSKSRSSISYNNVSDYGIKPMLSYDTAGYAQPGKTLELSNVDVTSTNLLINTSENDNPYELCKVVGEGYCKKPFDLLKQTNINFDSTFCDDQRFIGCEDVQNSTINISFNNNAGTKVLLSEGYYVFKVQSLFPFKNSDVKLTCKIGDQEEQDIFGSKAVFYIKGQTSILFKKLYAQLLYKEIIQNHHLTKIFNVISGIGLYKVNIDNLIDPKNIALSQQMPVIEKSKYIENQDNFYDNIVFPAAFCAEEDIDCFLPLADVGPKSQYGQSSTQYSKVKHSYNFSYLPEKAVYNVAGFYTIPSGSETTPKSVRCWGNEFEDILQVMKNKEIRS